MEDKVKLYVLGISYSQLKQGAYALILAQEDGPVRIPVVIGPAEAQSIAIRMERITPPRPMTHDLFMSFAHAFGIRLKEVFIYKFEDGIFSSELTFTDGDRTVVLDSRTSDAIAIAMRTKAPIYTTRHILEETGFVMEEQEGGDSSHENTSDPDEPAHDEPRPENMAVEELERTITKLIENDAFEEAARIQEILDRKLAERDGTNNTDSNQ